MRSHALRFAVFVALGCSTAESPASADVASGADAVSHASGDPDVAGDDAVDDVADDLSSPDDAQIPAPAPVAWEPCPLHTEGTGTDAECASIPVPLDRHAPTGPTLDLFVKRFRPPGGKGLRALWMLQGGPGASGWVFENLAEAMATRFPDVDYYMPDHRGTGRSARLDCPEQEAQDSPGGIFITPDEWPACRAHAQQLPGFMAYTTSNAANDLAVAIGAVHGAGPDRQPVFLFGVSYGTYLAHRVLQLTPKAIDGVVLDSVAPPGISLLRQDADSDEAAADYFAACAAHPVCSAHLGDDPWAVAKGLVQKLRDGHCPEVAVEGVPTQLLLRRLVGGLLMDPGRRGYAAAIVHRLDRCEARDQKALSVLFAQATGEQPITTDLRLWGWVLSNHVLFSEFAEDPLPTADELAQIRDDAVASRDITEALALHLGQWPTYPADDAVGQFANTDTPVLVLQGGLDVATILRKARALQPHLTGPHQTWVEIPSAGHTVIASSPFVDEVGERRSCGTRLLMQFVAAPTEPLDTGCVAKVEGIDFSLPRADLNKAFFGVEDAWD